MHWPWFDWQAHTQWPLTEWLWRLHDVLWLVLFVWAPTVLLLDWVRYRRAYLEVIGLAFGWWHPEGLAKVLLRELVGTAGRKARWLARWGGGVVAFYLVVWLLWRA